MKKYLVVSVFISLVLSACTSTAPSVTDSTEELTSSNIETPDSAIVKEFLMTEVEKHSVEADCWFVISGKVYDVSSSNSHPGGPAIFDGCGKDATELFETRPMGSGTPHSDNARKYLENYYVGELAK